MSCGRVATRWFAIARIIFAIVSGGFHLLQLYRQHRQVVDSPGFQEQLDAPFVPHKNATKQVAAYLEGHPLYLVHDSPPTSRVQCPSDNSQPDAGKYQFCRFTNLCFDLDTKTFVLHPSQHHQHLKSHTRDDVHISSVADEVMSGKWKPEIRDANHTTSYFAFSDDTVWISFNPKGGCDPGHHLWDEVLPLYTLLEMFGFHDDDKKLFLTRMPWITRQCDTIEYAQMMALMMDFSKLPKAPTDLELDGLSPQHSDTRLVCAKHSASGMGWLTDHGLNNHGSPPPDDFASPRNVGRGPNLVAFRNYCLKNLGIAETTTASKPHHVVFSVLSSQEPERRLDFLDQIEATELNLSEELVRVEGIAMWNHTLKQQVEIATQSSVYVSVCGGGSWPAMFLPPGASLILLGNEGERHDWDLWGNNAHVRTHWLSTKDIQNDTDLLVDLIRDELESIDSFQ